MNVWVEVAGRSAATLLSSEDMLEIAENAELLIRCRTKASMEPGGELHGRWLRKHAKALDNTGLDYELLPYDRPAQNKQALVFRNFPEQPDPHYQPHMDAKTTRTRSVAKTQGDLLAQFWPEFEKTCDIKSLALAPMFQERPRLLIPFGQPAGGWRLLTLTEEKIVSAVGTADLADPMHQRLLRTVYEFLRHDDKTKFQTLGPFDGIHPTREHIEKWNGELAKQTDLEYIQLCSERAAEFATWLREAMIEIHDARRMHDQERLTESRKWLAHLEWIERHKGILPPRPTCAEEPDGHHFKPPLSRDVHRIQDVLGKWACKHDQEANDDGLYRDNYNYDGTRETTLPEDTNQKRRVIEDRVYGLVKDGMLTEERLIDAAATYATVEGGVVVEQLSEQTGMKSNTLRARKKRVAPITKKKAA